MIMQYYLATNTSQDNPLLNLPLKFVKFVIGSLLGYQNDTESSTLTTVKRILFLYYQFKITKLNEYKLRNTWKNPSF